jgi:hypothetical protein
VEAAVEPRLKLAEAAEPHRREYLTEAPVALGPQPQVVPVAQEELALSSKQAPAPLEEPKQQVAGHLRFHATRSRQPRG